MLGREATVLAWLRERRRQKILEEVFPAPWAELLQREVALYRGLSGEERTRLHDDLRLFAAEVSWEGCGGQPVTDEMKLLVAAQACVLTLGRSLGDLAIVRSVLIYPEAYWAPADDVDEAGVVSEGEEDREGEAWESGLVVLSWSDLRQDARRNDGRNLVLHEFAHQLDMNDGEVNGTPRIDDAALRARWAEVMAAEFEALGERADKGRRGGVLDTYGAEDEGEFFAVCTEAFFERGREMKKKHPDLYAVLAAYYRQDPAMREERVAQP